MINKELVKELKVFQSNLEDSKAELKKLQDQFNKDNQYLFNIIIELNKDISETKTILSEEIIAEYKETGVKKLFGGLGVRTSKTLNYNKSDAFKWATEHNLFLTVDTASFESMAKTSNLDFVTIETVDKATFPKEIKLEGD